MGGWGIPEENTTSTKDTEDFRWFWALFIMMDPGRHVHCWLSNPPGQPQDLEDVVKLSKRLGRESRAQQGFRWEAPYITPANLRTSIGVNCDQLWQNKHRNGLCVDCPFTSRCSTALLVIQGKFREREEDTKHHIYRVRIDHWES